MMDIEKRQPIQGHVLVRRSVLALVVFLVVALAVIFLSPESLYLWVKAVHVIAVISWMAGLLYLPRLFIYHTESGIRTPQAETFKIMERRLYRLIMTPAMIVSWICGLWLAWSVFQFQGFWLHVKLLGVVALTGTHILFGRAVEAFNRDDITRPARYWRYMNEIPTLLMILIVIMVIVKPFGS
jgi:protoporphyrinogen IX oxidase